ncbi:hypothetical protein [Bradyrhizobium sp. SZCCHNRI2049]|uniref:glycosyltransferase family 2 protein n=1 Tax=Bradyrhizobium sp. SZCCHNRI2049 TaxID=3057287 RepID=UPI0029163A9F|nr:hypothetical protein [Bradyrhizobium sp. SZCCHNRI2049]
MTDLSPETAARLDRARQRSVMICTPVARNPVWQYTAALASTLLFLQEQGIRCTFQFVVGGSVIHKARNELCAHFLMSDYTDLLFVDDDMEWSPNAVLRLLASDKPLIAGAGRMRVQKPNSDPAVWCWRPLLRAGQLRQDEMGAIEVKGVGAAFMLINRRVLHDMATRRPEWKRVGAPDWPQDLRDHYYEFFRTGEEGSDVEFGEDYVFCNRWRAMGNEVWVDPTIRLGHVGSFNYAGALEDAVLVAAPPAQIFAANTPQEAP